MPFHYVLPLTVPQQKAVAARPDLAERRFRQWAATQALVILDGPALFPNRIELDADRDPVPLWNATALDTPDVDEGRDTALRAEIISLLGVLDNNTATLGQIRRAVFLTMRLAGQTILDQS